MIGQPVAVVTGAARGIGAAVVRRLAGDGWAVVAVDRCADDLDVPYPLASPDQLAALAAAFPQVRPVQADVRDATAMAGAVEAAEREFGRLDAAVAAAAVILGGGPAWELSDADWRTLLDVDVTGVLNLARAAVPALLRNPQPRHGRFVALASAAAHSGLWRLGGYCAAKHAVLGLVRALACDLQGTGVNAVAISPGSTRTDMLQATADIYQLADAGQLADHQLVRLAARAGGGGIGRGMGLLARGQRRHRFRAARRRRIHGMTRLHPTDAGLLAELAPPSDTRLPNGFAVELADDVHRSRDGRLILGGSPPRLLRFSKPAVLILEPGRFTVVDAATAAMARRLVDIGVVHPRPPAQPVRDVTIVIPVRDRASLLHQLLAALRADPETSGVPAIVVDDGSVNGAAVASVTRLHGATLLVHPHNQGPAAARNTGLGHARTGYVAFCDSDVLPQPGWLSPLLAQFADPALALAAPQIVGIPQRHPDCLDRYEDVRSPLGMGGREAPIVPLSALAYVPGAALVVRRAAVGGGFAPELRFGEDVDLCLRLHRAGWRMHYVPSARVGHYHRASLRSWVAQRASYGSGAAELAQRHPGQVPPLNAAPWSVAACALVLRGRPVPLGVAVALTAGAAIRLIRRIPDADTPVRAGALLTLAAMRGAAEQLTQCATRHYWPVAVLAAVMNRRARHVLIVGAAIEGLIDCRRSGACLNPLVYLLIRRLDDLAYGAGLWGGAIRHRTIAPLIPRLASTRGRPGRDMRSPPERARIGPDA